MLIRYLVTGVTEHHGLRNVLLCIHHGNKDVENNKTMLLRMFIKTFLTDHITFFFTVLNTPLLVENLDITLGRLEYTIRGLAVEDDL